MILRSESESVISTFGLLSQLTEDIQTGLPGLSVVSHVVVELNSVIDHATIQHLQTTEKRAKDLLKRHRYVPLKYASQQVIIF